jgi:phthalate 4,5-cis-dihydrodiol dehydrogenase
VRAVNRWQYSAWFYRTRAEDEREPSVGGIVLRQGAHEFDCLRMLLPSPPVRIHGWTGDYDANRPGEGAYYAWLECADGTIASSIHNGYDHFLSDEFTVGLLPSEVIGSNHRGLTGLSAEEEHLLKRTVGHARPEALQSRVFGFTLMSCEGADLRPSMGGGVYVYDERGRREFRASGQTGTSVIIQELYDAVTTGATALHDGSWGLAVLECCLGIRESAATHGDVELTRQGSVPRAVAQGILGDREMAEATE